MQRDTLGNLVRSVPSPCIATILIVALSAFTASANAANSRGAESAPRTQLSIGYSMLYQEAVGIPKIKWLLAFKDKSEEVDRLAADLISYYQQLDKTMKRLSEQFPAMRIDEQPMSTIEADARKAIGDDQAKDFAPLIGKKGVDFEREALLMFYNALNEQRHLVGVMEGLETEPALKKFLETTKTDLDARHAKVGALLKRRYFTH
ncbi:MAG TPA: hypothetical protein VGV09_21040 [Steroidobacteraceae bacterium]|nr:hypothetical protein [Steroidobacteraceae bacterium]